jgi:hypothetical protein
MAARRLLIVMLILLGLSTLAAALVPPQALREGTTTTTTTEETVATPPDMVAPGRDLKFKLRVGGKTAPVLSCEGKARRARSCKPLKVGDQLTLVVSSRRADQLEMPYFGLVDTVGPDQPASFAILPLEPGSYGIRFVSNLRIAARIVVEKRGAETPGEKKPKREPGARSGAPAESGRS